MKNLIIQKWQWAKQNPLFFATPVLLFLTWAVIFLWPSPIINETPSDFRIKAWGMVLQIIGVCTVWVDLTSAAREFKRTGILKRNLAWLNAGLGKQPTTIGVVESAQASTTSDARVSQRAPLDKTLQLDERISRIEENLGFIDREIAGVQTELSATSTYILSKLDLEVAERKSAVSRLKENLGDAVAGNYAILLFGLIWLVAGIALSTLAPELAKLAAGQWRVVLDAI